MKNLRLELAVFSALLILPLAQARADGSGPPPLQVLSPEFSASVTWTSDPDTGEDVLRGYVQYTPPAASKSCASIRLIQVARVEVTPGQELQWQGSEENRNQMRTQADPSHGIEPGYFVDHDAGKCSEEKSCSPYYRDSWPIADESQDGSNIGSTPKIASLVDYPVGWTQFQRITLESCARCVDTGEFYGCVSWGGNWPDTGERAILGPKLSAAPSPTFLASLSAFIRFYGMNQTD